MTARVLADHFEQVTVLERDHIEDRPAIHQIDSQGNHLHALSLAGQQVLARLYPASRTDYGTSARCVCAGPKTSPSCLPTARLTQSAARSGSRATSVSMSIARAATCLILRSGMYQRFGQCKFAQ